MKKIIVSLTLFQFLALSVVFADSLPRPVRLGAVIPLTGDLAHYGNEIKNGMVLAREKSELPVELFFEDAPLLGPKILTGFNRLVTHRNIDALAGNFSNQAMLLMAPSIDRLHLPAFHTAAADEQILASSDWVFTTNIRVADEARKVAEHVFFALKARRAAVLAVETSFGLGYRAAFIERFQELGGQIVADELQSTEGFDTRTQLLRIRAAKPDVVFLGTFGPYLGSAVRQIKQLGMREPLFTVYEVEDPSVVASAGVVALEGIRYFVSYGSDADFEVSYRTRFHCEPSTFSRNSYDATQLLIQSVVQCNFDRECIKESMYHVTHFHGASGEFDIEADGATRKMLSMHEFRNGRFQPAQAEASSG